jgi:hypothetical protein
LPSYRRGRWIARQKRDGIEYCIGTFQTYDQAVQAQNRFNARWPRRLNKDTLVFRKELEQLINRNSRENGSNTPDFILAQYIEGCLRQPRTRQRLLHYRQIYTYTR